MKGCIVPVRSRTGPPLVLYVDDNSDDRFLMERAANRGNTDFDLQTATGMQDAINYFENAGNLVPALLLIDYSLKEFRAPALLRWLTERARWAQIPTVILSGNDDPACITACYAAGAQSFLSKPKVLDEVTEMVSALGLCFAGACVTLEPLKTLSCYRGCRLVELRSELEEQGRQNAGLREQQAQLLGELDIARAEAKESKRKYRYPGKRGTDSDI